MTESLLKNKGIRGFIQVLFSNCILILMGVISSFIVPSSITPEEFGYWQTYLLYEAYVGLVLFGYCDGIYLRYGGKEYGQLPKRRFTAFFCIMLLYLVIVCTVFVAIVFSSDMGAKNSCIFYAVAISMLLRCLISFFVLINQATARFNIYSIGNIIEKIFFVCLLLKQPSSQMAFPYHFSQIFCRDCYTGLHFLLHTQTCCIMQFLPDKL